MSGQVSLRAVTDESIEVPVQSSVDPSGGTVSFAVSAAGASSPGAYVAGTWPGTWSSSTRTITALTPKIGSSSALAVTAGTWDLWAKVTGVGGETPQWVVGQLVVT